MSALTPVPSVPAAARPSRGALTGGGVLAGAAAWVAVAHYFVVLLVVRAAWTTPYSVLSNTISDLGAAGCGEHRGRDVCSPWHVAANVSWVATGACLLLGALLLRPVLARGAAGRVGLALIGVAGVGELVVGLSPEDVSATHVPAAAVAIVGGLAGLLTLGASLARTPGLRGLGVLGVGFGALGATALVLGVTVVPERLVGLVERLAAYPILVWAVAAGVTVLVRRRAHASAASSS
ncbi:DUF998 domain-containing protein [Cellulomonas iranensis]|uniref:DUF998 domain-containing protein n=1 Tax=Cellulomonas iranensis TaxID=76862 RepID=UPI001CF36503|nr:DUF998 domain-containing protein [Cellulomonas iranensis]UCN14147.1 DUF998 domain-containing protein [Cellulomonas iranensis]